MKIANKISLSFLLTVVIIITAAGAIYYTAAKNNLKNAIFDHLTTAAQSRAEHIETFLEVHRHVVELLAAGLIFEELLTTSKDTPEYNQRLKRVNNGIRNVIKVDKEIFKVSVLDKNGIVVASTDEASVGSNKSADKTYLKAKEATCIEDMHIHKPAGVPYIDIAAPVLLNGESLGVIIVGLITEKLFKITLDRTGLGETGEIYLVNKDAYMITPSRSKEDVILRQKVDTENCSECLEDLRKYGLRVREFDEAEKEGERDIRASEDYRGIRVIGTDSQIPEMQWCLLAEIDGTIAGSERNSLKPALTSTVARTVGGQQCV